MTANSNGFFEYLPQGYDSDAQNYPLMVFLHGAGESGNGDAASLSRVLANGVPRCIKDGIFPNSFTVNGQVFKFIVISPQFKYWPSSKDVDDVIKYAVKNYRVNKNRIYLTGLSMGGGAAWEYAGDNAGNANSLAAMVPVSGAWEPVLSSIKIMADANLPIWALHNQGDLTVPVLFTNKYVDDFNVSVPTPSPLARKTIFPVNDHDAWTLSYNPSYRENNLNIYEWMLQFENGKGKNKVPVANAGNDMAITLPANIISLAGSGTDDDGNIVQYRWLKVSGPSSYAINDWTLRNPVVGNLEAGDYIFRLTVMDNEGATASDDVAVKVNAAVVNAAVVNAQSIPGRVEAESYQLMSGILVEKSANGITNIGNVDNGDWVEYKVNVANDGYYNLVARMATPFDSQQFNIRNADGTVLTTVDVPKTGGFQVWGNILAGVSLKSGVQTIRIYSVKGGWNLDWLEFSLSDDDHAIPGKIEAESYNAMSGIEAEKTNDDGGGSDIGYFDTGDWIDYDVNVAATGKYTVNLRLATPYVYQRLQLLNSSGGLLGTVEMQQTGGFQNWATMSTALTLPAGKQRIRLLSLRGTFNVNWMEFLPVPGAVYDGPADGVSQAVSNQRITANDQQKSISTLYPNPVRSSLALGVGNRFSGELRVQVLGPDSHLIREYRYSKNQPYTTLTIPVEGLPAGIYTIKMDMNGWSEIKRFTKL